jgi:Cthe_2314-like HEPN
MFFEFPTKDEWRESEGGYPFEKLEVSAGDFQYTAHPQGSMERFSAIPNIITWTAHLQNRLIQTRWSYVLLMFHFCKGIPDEEWFISPGKKDQSVEYYPHFEKKDHLVYADIFYYKLFSAWDTLGQLPNVTYDLEIERASFYKAVEKLKTVKPTLFSKLKGVMDSPDFEKMPEIRHNIAHNHLPGHVGSTVERFSTDKVKE